MKVYLKFKDSTVTYMPVEHRLEYETMKEQIDTSIVEHLLIKIGDRNYDAWLCEEGLLRNLRPEVIMMLDGKPYNHLAGTVLLSLTDNDGYACGLEQDDVDYIVSNLKGADMSIEIDDQIIRGSFPLFEYGYYE
jgi:hypothetical protein